MTDGGRLPIRCRWFGHKFEYVVRFADPAKDYRACSHCEVRSMVYPREEK